MEKHSFQILVSAQVQDIYTESIVEKLGSPLVLHIHVILRDLIQFLSLLERVT